MSGIPPAISQVGYPGAGDIDDCWAVASIWSAHAADPTIKLPTMSEFRAAALNPDKPGPTGGDLRQIVRASVWLWPDLPVSAYSSLDWSGFAEKLRAGSVASLAVLSARLPAYLRFGFMGAHQVGVIVVNGEWYVMNPLQDTGDPPLKITEPSLQNAAQGVANGWVLAALYQPVAGGEMIQAPEGLTSPQRVRMTKDADLLDAPSGKRIAGTVIGRTYAYIGTVPGHRAVLVNTALPYPDGKIRPTVLYVVSGSTLVEDAPPSAAPNATPHKVSVTITGAGEVAVGSVTF